MDSHVVWQHQVLYQGRHGSNCASPPWRLAETGPTRDAYCSVSEPFGTRRAALLSHLLCSQQCHTIQTILTAVPYHTVQSRTAQHSTALYCPALYCNYHPFAIHIQGDAQYCNERIRSLRSHLFLTHHLTMYPLPFIFTMGNLHCIPQTRNYALHFL